MDSFSYVQLETWFAAMESNILNLSFDYEVFVESVEGVKNFLIAAIVN